MAMATDAHAGLLRLARDLEYDVSIAAVDAEVKLVWILNQSTMMQLLTYIADIQ
jgi:hypothetical protein